MRLGTLVTATVAYLIGYKWGRQDGESWGRFKGQMDTLSILIAREKRGK